MLGKFTHHVSFREGMSLYGAHELINDGYFLFTCQVNGGFANQATTAVKKIHTPNSQRNV